MPGSTFDTRIDVLNTDDLETLLGLGVDEVLAINLKSGDSGGGANQGTGSRKHTAVRLYHVSIPFSFHTADFIAKVLISLLLGLGFDVRKP
jgi:hypothetical protein